MSSPRYYWPAACLLLAAVTFGFSGEWAARRAAAQPASLRFEFSQAHMGTQFRIVLYASDAATATRVSNAAFNRIAELDNIMSDYNPSSELMLLCQRAGGRPVQVSEDLFYVLEKSQELAKRSDGAFDITVGPVVQLWRRARRRREMPDRERLAHALELVGYEKLRLDPKARTAQLLKPGMLLDLGGIAKGYAADEALAVLKRHGIRSALVAAGGDIAVSSPPPDKEGQQGWTIGIAPLEAPDKPPTRYISLRDAGVSTSGDAEQHVEIGGIRYSHIVNPKTGLALTGHSSVTVLAPDGITADGMATTVSVLGPKRGLELIDSTAGAAVLFAEETDQGIRSFESHFPPAEGSRRKVFGTR